MRIKMELNPQELQNLIAFGNRATMQGNEADTWVALKGKLSVELNAQMVELSEKVEMPGGDGAPKLSSID